MGYELGAGGRDGESNAEYDQTGNTTWLGVYRQGPCLPVCTGGFQYFEYYYQWDEVGRLVRANRWNPDLEEVEAELRFAYDASDQRVRKTAVDPSTADERHTLYIFGSLELRLAEFVGGEYEVNEATEVPYLYAHGVRLARVVHTAPGLLEPSVRVFLELGDHLGTNAAVLDHATGEVVERSTAYAYGAPESNYRPGRWHEFREDYRFTGKEDDIEVGLIYFGARYLNPLLNRWISPDPLAVHAPGKADLNLYAYVHGKVLIAVDPVGLEVAGGVSPDNPLAPYTPGEGGKSSGPNAYEYAPDTVYGTPPKAAAPAPGPAPDPPVGHGERSQPPPGSQTDDPFGISPKTQRPPGPTAPPSTFDQLVEGNPAGGRTYFSIPLPRDLLGLGQTIADAQTAFSGKNRFGKKVSDADRNAAIARTAVSFLLLALPLAGGKVRLGSLGRAGKVGSEAAAQLSTAAQRAIRSTEARLAEHEAKLAAYRENPFAFDNRGDLARNAARPEVQQRIIDGRIRHLEGEIKNFQNQLEGLRSGKVEP